MIPDVHRIAVLRANAVGDLMFALPALEALRAAYPAAEIVLLGAPWHARFLTGRPGPVDRVLVLPAQEGVWTAVPDGDPGPTPAEFAAAAAAERFDLALQLHGGGGHTNPIVAGLGARVTAGLRAPGAPPLDRWIRYVYFQPEVFRYLEVVGLVGAAPVTWRPRLAVTDRDRDEADRVAGPPDGRRVALHPGATDPRRRWPAERFAAVGDQLAAEVLVTGTESERRLVEEVVDRMRKPARPLIGALSLGGLAGLYAGCDLVVANDTGPLHLAAAVGAATVGVFWAGNMINGAPMERGRHRPLVSWTMRCPVCGADAGHGPRCPHDPSFVTDIPVRDVVQAALDLLESPS